MTTVNNVAKVMNQNQVNTDNVENDTLNTEHVHELQTLLRQVEESEKQAWNWLEALETENAQRLRDLQEYVASIELNKTNTSEAIAELLQIECRLREQLSRQTLTMGYPSINNSTAMASGNDDVSVRDISSALEQIACRLRGNSATTATGTNRAFSEEKFGKAVGQASMQRHIKNTSDNFQTVTETPGAKKVDASDGSSSRVADFSTTYDAKAENSYEYATRSWVNRKNLSAEDTDQLKAKIARQDAELEELRKEINTLLTKGCKECNEISSHLKERINTEEKSTGLFGEMNRMTSVKDSLQASESVMDMELNNQRRPINASDLLIKQKSESDTKNELVANISQRADAEIQRKTLTIDKNERHESADEEKLLLERQVHEMELTERELLLRLEDKEQCIESWCNKSESWEHTKNNLTAQIEFLTRTNESLMDDIDDLNVRMSEELTSCRNAKALLEAKCVHVEAERDKLHETVNALAAKNKQLEKAAELATHHQNESQRLQHELEVLLASEEKLMDKLSDKDESIKKLMEELTECKKCLEQQSYELKRANDALDTYKTLEKRYLQELDNVRLNEHTAQDTERSLTSKVQQLEMSEAVLNTKLASLEADKVQAISTEASLRHQLKDCQRIEKELGERIIQLEKSESALQAKLMNSEISTASLVETLKTAQQMSLHTQFRCMFDSFDNFNEDPDGDMNGLQQHYDDHDVTNDYVDQEHESWERKQKQPFYQMERMTKVEMISKIYRLERKSAWQRHRLNELKTELETCRRKHSGTVTTDSESLMVPAWMSVVENKVRISR